MGEAPGYNEEQTGRLFSGPAGRLLDEALGEVGLKRDWFFVTNAVKCRPVGNRTPTAREVRTCSSSYLYKEIVSIQPQYGLALGNAGCQAVFGKKGITKLNGQVIESHGVNWVAAYHPAAVLRNPRYRNPFLGALLIFARLIRDEQGLPQTQTVLVNDKQTLRELLEQLTKAKVASIDVETWSSHPSVGRFKGGGLAYWHDDFRITAINFSFRQGYAYVLPLAHDLAAWKNWEQVRDIIKPYMENVPCWVMHNGKYDSKCLQRIGINLRHSADTMGMEYTLDENNIKDLGFLSQVYLGAERYKEMIDKTNTRSEDLNLMREYGGKDADYTLRLYSTIGRRLSNERLAKRLYDKLLHPADLTLTNVEYLGMPLDASKLADRARDCAKHIKEVSDEIYDLVGWQFNINSYDQLGSALFNHLEFPVLERTKGGKPSTNDGVLVRLKTLDDLGIIEKVQEYRLWRLYQSRYLNPWSELADSEWRLHPHFKPYHTVTGRLSCESPNMQQVPRNVFIRGLIGGNPGWTIIEADYSQIEMRLAAHYSQDTTLLRIFNSGRDVHMEMAMSITGKAEQDISYEERKMAKSVNFGFLYGMGWHKFIVYAKDNYELDVSEAEAIVFRKEFFRNFRSLPEWHERQRKKARRSGFVLSAIGRKRHLHDIESSNQEVKAEAERQAINSPVQSLASDMMLMAMIRLDKILPGKEARIISTVHDSILFEVRDNVVGKWAQVIQETMENLPLEDEFDCLLTVPIIVDIKYGSYWSEGAQAFDL